MALTPTQFDAVIYIEEFYYRNGRTPTNFELAGNFGKSEQVVAKWFDDAMYEALEMRGIIYNKSTNGLTADQLLVANTMLNLADGRSQKKKLQDLKISAAQYSAWTRDPVFQDYMRTRAEQMMGDSLHEAHLALIDNVRHGDLGSLKLYYEMVGRWSTKTANEVNIEFVIIKLMEIIQKHVKDPAILTAIAEEITGLTAAQPQQHAITMGVTA